MKVMTTKPIDTVGRTELPVNATTDSIRLAFYSSTGMVLPHAVCQACWLNIVALATGTIERRVILEVEHNCPHRVEPDIVLYHALVGLPEESYWAMADPWNESALGAGSDSDPA